MRLIDIHTHNAETCNASSIFNSKEYTAGRNISIGIHPWNISNSWKEEFVIIRETAGKENVRAIGECGIDKTNSPVAVEIQKEVFKAHAQLAEEVEKPLIIHCVKGFDEIIAIRNEISPEQAWIIHGFRGKTQQAEQLIKHGFYISFGERFNIDSLKKTPIERLFVESDESPTELRKIYERIAEAKECDITELILSVIRNAQKCNIIL